MEAPTLGLRETKKRETREHIARVGVQLFVERGFDAVSVADIAHAARVSKVTVFNYFPAKEDIFLFSAAHGMPDFGASVEGVQSESDLVRAVWEYVRQEFTARAEWSGLHENAETFAQVVDRSPALRRAMYDTWARLRSDFVSTAVKQLASITASESDRAMLRILATQIIATVEELTALNRDLAREQKEVQGMLDASLQLVDRAFLRTMNSTSSTG